MIEREDLKDIKNTVAHLNDLAKVFHKFNVEDWSILWYARNKRAGESLENLYFVKDKDFINAVESVYREGRQIAVDLSYDLPLIDQIEVFPKIF